MKLYGDNGYIDQDRILQRPDPFIFQIGPRGTGKSYGILKYILKNNITFLLLRRTQTEADMIRTNVTNPFKSVLQEFPGLEITYTPIARNLGGFTRIGEEGDTLIGYIGALSTFANVRGVDFSEVEMIFYDEFIPEKRARPIKDEYEALLNVIETVNRNRELQHRDPVKLVCAANSNDIANPIFIGLRIVEPVARMMKKGTEYWMDPERGLSVYMFMHSPISEQKEQTALYKLSAGSSFQDMALRNMFDLDDRAVSSRKLTEYKPLVRIGEMVVYQHKSRDEWYIRLGSSGTVPTVYETNDIDRKRFIAKYGYLFLRYLSGYVVFENSTAQILFERYFA